MFCCCCLHLFHVIHQQLSYYSALRKSCGKKKKKTCSVFSCSVQWQKQKCTCASGPYDPLLAVHLNASFGLYPITDLLGLSHSVISKSHLPPDMTCHHRPRKAEGFLHSAGFFFCFFLNQALGSLTSTWLFVAFSKTVTTCKLGDTEDFARF